MSTEAASEKLAEEIRMGTQDWLDVSAKEFTQFTPINFGIERIQKIAEESGISLEARTQLIDASRRMRHGLSPQDPSDWRRNASHVGMFFTKHR